MMRHEGAAMDEPQPILARQARVFLIGVGLIGSELLTQIREFREQLLAERGLDIRIAGLANSRRMWLPDSEVDLARWRDELTEQGGPLSPQAFLDAIRAQALAGAILVDCTASEAVVALYADALRAGVPVVAANKKANAGPYARFEELHELSRLRRVRYLYETNVAAGLPVIAGLESLNVSGDRLRRMEAVLSGTLSYLFNVFDGGRPFSDLVREAQQMGFTEPDPREDLNGMDVARKLMIVARAAGQPLELADIEVESLVSAEGMNAPSVDAFFEVFREADPVFAQRREEAAAAGCALRYVAVLDERGARVGLRAVEPSHPCWPLSGCDNLISFYTDRYCDTPMVMKGPGAGAAVTAAGVFADIVRAAES